MTIYQIVTKNEFGEYLVVLSTHRSRDAAVRRLNEVRKWDDAASIISYAK